MPARTLRVDPRSHHFGSTGLLLPVKGDGDMGLMCFESPLRLPWPKPRSPKVCVRFSFQGPSGDSPGGEPPQTWDANSSGGRLHRQPKRAVAERNFGGAGLGDGFLPSGFAGLVLVVLRGPRGGCRGALARGKEHSFHAPEGQAPFPTLWTVLEGSGHVGVFVPTEPRTSPLLRSPEIPGVVEGTAKTA